MKRRGVLIVLLVLFASSPFSWAQLDPKAQPFLDAYTASFENAKMPGFTGKTLKTIDMTMCMTFYAAPEPPSEETCSRTAMDMTRRWMMTETSGEFSSKTVYRDGKARMRIVGFSGPRELPQAQTKQLEQTFQAMFEQLEKFQNGELIIEDFKSSRYDGFVRYGKVLEGEKVTATMVIPTFGVGPNGNQPSEMQLIFNKEKTVIGMVTQAPEGTSLSVFTKPMASNPLQRFMNMTFYGLKGNKPVRQGTMRFLRFKINAPLNETLFTLKPKK